MSSVISLGNSQILHLDPTLGDLKSNPIVRLKHEGSVFTLCAEEKGAMTWLKANIFCRSEYNAEKICNFFETHNNESFSKDSKIEATLKHLMGRIEGKNDASTKKINDLYNKIFSPKQEIPPNKPDSTFSPPPPTSEPSARESILGTSRSKPQKIKPTIQSTLPGWQADALKELLKRNPDDADLIKKIDQVLHDKELQKRMNDLTPPYDGPNNKSST